MFPYDEEFEEESGQFDRQERPTVAEGRRRERKRLAQDPDYKLGRIIVASIQMRRDIDFLLRNYETARKPSIRPQVQTVGLGAGAAIVVAVLVKIVELLGIIKP